MTKPITTSELKTHCSRVIEEVSRTREAVLITKRGRPVAKLVPIDDAPESLFGFARGTVTVHGDIVSPLEVMWEAHE